MASGLKGKLTVTIHKAKDLKNVQTFGKQDPYVDLKIGQEHFKTRVISGGGRDPVWEQSFLFNLTGAEDALHIKVNDSETTLDRPIGRCDIQLKDLVIKAAKPCAFQVLDVSNFSKMAGQLLISAEFSGTGLISSSTSTSTSTSTPTPTPVQQQTSKPVYQQAPPIYQQAPPPPVYQPPPVQMYAQAPPQPQVIYGQPVSQPVVYGQPIVLGQHQVIYGQPQPTLIYAQPQPQVRYY